MANNGGHSRNLSSKVEEEDSELFAFTKAAELRSRTGGALPGPMPFSELMAR